MADGKIKFFFSKSPHYRLTPATGVWGGPTPTGQIRVDFFVDSANTPESVVHAITAEGKAGEEVAREPSERTIARELQVGVLLTPDLAESMIRWLQGKLALLKKADADDVASEVE